jgi:hypothetical protein
MYFQPVAEVMVQHGLAHLLLNVELLPFGSISTEECELKTVSEGHPHLWTPASL